MEGLLDIGALVLAAEEDSGGGKFLVQPGVGLMIWTLIAFGITLWVLRRYVFPQIQDQLDKRQRAIEETIDTAERTKLEADQLLAEYRQRLQEARQQAEDLVGRARKAADTHQQEVQQAASLKQQEMLDQARGTGGASRWRSSPASTRRRSSKPPASRGRST